jgi:energy-coupling factor transporter ATP-binding protein EcfA2
VKIRWVEATNFRKFVGTVRVDGIGDGLNVLVGPNEMGKSTLMEAINGVVFQKANSQSKEVKSFNHSFNRTVPEVSLGFDLNDQSWTVRKRFAGSAGRAWLQSSDGRCYEGEAAEAELQRLLGFTIGGRSAEPGIWGTLWVRQGRSFGDPALDEHARRTLHDCLESQVGAVTGGVRGQRIPKAVEEALDTLVSAKDVPRGRYKIGCEELERTRPRIRELEAKRTKLFEEMERLASLKRDLRNLNEDWNEEENAQQIATARQECAEAERKVEEIKAVRSAVELAAEKARNAAAKARQRADLIAEINLIEMAVQKLRLRAEAAKEVKDQAAARLAAKEQALRNLGDRQRQLTEAERRLHRIRGVISLATEIDRYQAIVGQVQESQKEAEELGEELGRITATGPAIAQIDEAERELSAAKAALDAVATNVALAIDQRAIERVTINGKLLDTRDVTHSIVEDLVIGIAGIGEIAIRPQVKDREAVLHRVKRAEQALKHALAEAGADTPACARAAAGRRRELEHRLEALRKAIGRLTPGDKKRGLAPGTEVLKIRIKELRGRCDEEMRLLGLETLPDGAAVEGELSGMAAEAAKLADDLETANAELLPVKEAAEQARTAFEGMQRALAAENRDLQTKTEALTEGRRRVSDDLLATAAEELARAAGQSQDSLAQLKQKVGETIEEIDAQIRRLENAARNHQDELMRLRTEIAKSSATITAGEGDGVEEELENARAEEFRLDNEVENYKREVKVLRLLKETLRTAESEAKARYLAPVITRVEPYLRVLLPGTDLMLDEDLHIASLSRNGMLEEFTKLSEGTREQIAVLARLGFAELLLGQGRPATIILDDALVFSDDERIERMFDIMTRASERLQIILLTCRKRLFTRLGARMLIVESSDMTMAA